MALCLPRLLALAALCGPGAAAPGAAPGQLPAGWPGLRRSAAPAAPLAGGPRAAQAPAPGGWPGAGAAVPAAAIRAQTLLRDDRADLQDMLLQPMPSSMEGVGQLQGGRGRLQSLAQRQPVRAPQPRGAGDAGLLAVDPTYCDPPCDAARGGVCAIRSTFAWSAGGTPTCVCSDPAAGGAGCAVGAAAPPGGLLARGMGKVGGVLDVGRVPTEASVGLHVRDLATVWVLAAAATAGLFALFTCWLRRPAAKAAALGAAGAEERPSAPALGAPRLSQEEWVRAATARRPAARTRLQQSVPQVVRDDSDEGELDG